MASENKEALCPCGGAPEMPRGEGCPMTAGCRGAMAREAWPPGQRGQSHGDHPSIMLSWKGGPHSAQIPALPRNQRRGPGKLPLSSESQSPLL